MGSLSRNITYNICQDSFPSSVLACNHLYLSHLQELKVIVLNMRVMDTCCLEPGRFGEDHWKLKKECATLRRECSELPHELLGQPGEKLEVHDLFDNIFAYLTTRLDWLVPKSLEALCPRGRKYLNTFHLSFRLPFFSKTRQISPPLFPSLPLFFSNFVRFIFLFFRV